MKPEWIFGIYLIGMWAGVIIREAFFGEEAKNDELLWRFIIAFWPISLMIWVILRFIIYSEPFFVRIHNFLIKSPAQFLRNYFGKYLEKRKGK